jgi:hypothetical protein
MVLCFILNFSIEDDSVSRIIDERSYKILYCAGTETRDATSSVRWNKLR